MALRAFAFCSGPKSCEIWSSPAVVFLMLSGPRVRKNAGRSWRIAVIASVPAIVGSWSSARLITSGFRDSRAADGAGADVAVEEAGFAQDAASTRRRARVRRADMTDLDK